MEMNIKSLFVHIGFYAVYHDISCLVEVYLFAYACSWFYRGVICLTVLCDAPKLTYLVLVLLYGLL